MSLSPADVGNEWEFYFCRVDDAPASIFLNLWFAENRPDSEISTLYYVGLQMLEPGEHGMGLESEAEKLGMIEEMITTQAAAAGLFDVARLRNNGDWQITFYGPPGKEAELEQCITNSLDDRGYRTGHKADPNWEYWDGFLMPDGERWRWIMDRRVLENLQKEGDSLETPRPVDHFIRFTDPKHREKFTATAKKLGFETRDVDGPEDTEDSLRFGIEITRTDSVQLEQIHEVVMELETLAEHNGGDYDGWGTEIVRAH